ncbi:YceI family protein [Rhodoferax sp.]|uniref:YceI family protein n=1 Tax=Rhodoferax sp. TaxID=50421 RepID=UPI001A0F8110|nr:YceI family protein [Rhodoferax sp.]MBE0474256.1 YceI family protein [Rhodoferax sp.]
MRLSLVSAAALSLLALGSQAQAASYAIDPAHTYVTFEISHFGTSTNRGRFDKKEGKVEFDRAAKTGKVETTIDRTQFGMNYGIDWGFPKQVRLLIQVEAVKQ